MPERKIFISYRRADNPHFADRIRDKFITIYGRDNVFMDIDSLPRGAKVTDRIRSAVEQSDAVIAVIGLKWVGLFREKAFEDDFVKMELELALKLHKPITPICIDDASIPSRSDLPQKLRHLLDYNFASLNRSNFHEEMERIIADIEAAWGKAQPSTAQYYYDSAEKKLLDKDYEGAIADCIKALEAKPEFAEAYNLRGQAYSRKGYNNVAIDDFTDAIRLNPQYAEAYCNRADTLAEDDDFDSAGEALQDYNDAIRLNHRVLYSTVRVLVS